MRCGRRRSGDGNSLEWHGSGTTDGIVVATAVDRSGDIDELIVCIAGHDTARFIKVHGAGLLMVILIAVTIFVFQS